MDRNVFLDSIQSIIPLTQAFTLLRIEKRPFSKDCGAFALCQRNIISTWKSLVDHGPFVPECNCTWRPFPPHREVICVKEVFAEEFQDVGGLLAVELLNPINEGRIVS